MLILTCADLYSIISVAYKILRIYRTRTKNLIFMFQFAFFKLSCKQEKFRELSDVCILVVLKAKIILQIGMNFVIWLESADARVTKLKKSMLKFLYLLCYNILSHC